MDIKYLDYQILSNEVKDHTCDISPPLLTGFLPQYSYIAYVVVLLNWIPMFEWYNDSKN